VPVWRSALYPKESAIMKLSSHALRRKHTFWTLQLPPAHVSGPHAVAGREVMIVV